MPNEPTLRELLEQRFDALELLIDERRRNDLRAVTVAKDTADAALQAHNDLIKRGEAQAKESQRQLDKLTDTYATLDNLATLETLIEARLKTIEQAVSTHTTVRQATRNTWSDVRTVTLIGLAMIGVLLTMVTILLQR